MPATRSARKGTKKTPHATPATNTLSDDAPSNPSPDERRSTKGPDTGTSEGLSPVVDGKKVTGRQGKAGQAPKVGRPRAQVKATPTHTLPNRPGRNVHPVEADHKAEMKALEDRICEVQAAKEHLTRLNVTEEREEDNLPVAHPQAVSTVTHKRRYVDVETDGDESFDFKEVDDGSHSDNSDDSSSESNKATAETRTKSQRTKRVKGAARQELQTRMEELRGAKHRNVKKSQRQQTSTQRHDVGSFTVQDLRCKKYANAGLRPQPLAPPDVDQFQQPEADPFELGGICDSDLEDTRPAIAEVRGPQALVTANLKLQCNPSRKNELVRVREKTEGVDPGKPHATRKPPKSKAAKVPIVKAIPYKDQEPQADEPFTEAHPDVTRACLNDPRWTCAFLPTLSHALYISDHPFTDWTWDTGTLVKTIQMVFELTFTNISYVLSLRDSIVKAAYDRMETRRSKIASDVLTLVKTFFEGAEFKNQPEKVKEYVHWALRKDHPDYPRPDGFLRSQFILPIAETYIGFSTKSVLSPSLGPRNPPKGLYAVILTVVERAMRAHITGAFHSPSDFNHRTMWNSMKDFFQILNQVSASRWTQALDFTGYDDTENPNHIDESLLSAYRINFYIPSSPAKSGA
ncbi:hypothetical protein EDB85DRAFT_2147190 [Lactarius pseudohatsudake]|nr:hypothetical protein EDB85DRAFT_2147190 [Lactarius pseudohatsudake]